MTFARRLSQFGYAAVACGKLYHDGPDQMQGWTSRYGADMHVTPAHIAGQDEAAWGSFRSTSSFRGRNDIGEILHAGVGHGRFTQDRDRYALEGFEQYIDHHFLDLYTDMPELDQPLLALLSFNRPHYPYLTDEENLAWYLNRVTPFLEDIPFEHPVLNRRRVRVETDVTERDLRKATAAYYGMIEEVDTDFGRAIDRIHQAGQDPDDWWIIFTSDHGEMLGQHGVWEKKTFFEASARVPLVIRPPRAVRDSWGMTAGRTVTKNVNLCDLFATLCDLAEVPLPDESDTVRAAGLDSRSLLPLMRDPDLASWDNETISQFAATDLLIKRNDLKYLYYARPICAEHPEVLFDLSADPTERRNLISEPGYADALASFRQRRAELNFGPGADGEYRNAGYAWEGNGELGAAS